MLWATAVIFGIITLYTVAKEMFGAFAEARIALIEEEVRTQQIANDMAQEKADDTAAVMQATRPTRIASENAVILTIAIIVLVVSGRGAASGIVYFQRKAQSPIVQEIGNGRVLVSYEQLVNGTPVPIVAVLDGWTGERYSLNDKTAVSPERVITARAAAIQEAASQQVVTTTDLPSANVSSRGNNVQQFS